MLKTPLARPGFAEPAPKPDPETGKKGNHWFAINADQPLFAFAGLFVPQWTSVRRLKDGETTDDLFAFLTTKPNGIVAPIHHKAMPVILTQPGEFEAWLTAPWEEAKALQRPLPDEWLVEVDKPV